MPVKARVILGIFVVSMVSVACAAAETASDDVFVLTEIGRGQSWVSPIWGYTSPKLVFDGSRYYAAGLWGSSPSSSEGVVYSFDGASWQKGRRLSEIYQPASLLLDDKSRLVVAYARRGKPPVFLRAQSKGDANRFDEIPPPPEMINAYYLGAAIRGHVLHLAYVTHPDLTMRLAQVDLETQEWTPPIVVRDGQMTGEPRVFWTYPILFADGRGVHLVASNCPDGDEGNTFNRVWYSFYPHGASAPTREEVVAECQVGHNAFAMDMLVDEIGAVQVVIMWNQHVYGPPLPQGTPAAGTYRARRDPVTGVWQRDRVTPATTAGLYSEDKRLFVLANQNGTVVPHEWRGGTEQAWEEFPPLSPRGKVPAGPILLDVLNPASGSDLKAGPAVLADGLLPVRNGQPQERVLWAIIPADQVR